MKQILLAIVLCCSCVFAANYKQYVPTDANITLQATVGEAAVNNILATYFDGMVKQVNLDGNMGSVTVAIHNVGIDIQGENNVIAHLAFSLTVNVPSLPMLSFSNFPVEMNVPLKESFFVEAVDDAYAVFMSFKGSVESALKAAAPLLNNSYAAPVVEAITKAFNIAETKYVVPANSAVQNRESYFAVWKQDFGTLLLQKLDAAGAAVDFVIKGFSIALNVGSMTDHLLLTFNATIEAQNQFFAFKDGVLASNKEFTLLSVIGLGPAFGAVPVFCFAQANAQAGLAVDIVDFCKDSGMDMDKQYLEMKLSYRVKTKHGGILSFEADGKGVK